MARVSAGARSLTGGAGDTYLSSYVMAVTPDDVHLIASDDLTPERMALVALGDVKTGKDQLTPWASR
jgi:hypothetical protein